MGKIETWRGAAAKRNGTIGIFDEPILISDKPVLP
jgi:hypothetical protein